MPRIRITPESLLMIAAQIRQQSGYMDAAITAVKAACRGLKGIVRGPALDEMIRIIESVYFTRVNNAYHEMIAQASNLEKAANTYITTDQSVKNAVINEPELTPEQIRAYAGIGILPLDGIIRDRIADREYWHLDDGPSTYWEYFGMPGQAWCAMYAVYCIHRAIEDFGGDPVSVVPMNASTTGLAEWFMNPDNPGTYHEWREGTWSYGGKSNAGKSCYDPGYIPKPGDLILLETNSNFPDGPDHTGLVVDVIFDDNGNLVQIITAEGNTSSNGGNVTNKTYDVPGGSGRIIGFCSPDYGRV